MCFPHLSKRLSMLCTRLGERVFLSILNVYTGKNFTQKSFVFPVHVCVCTCTIPISFNRVAHQGKNIPLSAYLCIYRKSYGCHTLLLPKGILHHSKQAIAHCNTTPGKQTTKTWKPLTISEIHYILRISVSSAKFL